MDSWMLYVDHGTGMICDGPHRTFEEGEREGERQMAKGATAYSLKPYKMDDGDLFPGEIPTDYDGPLVSTAPRFYPG